MPAPSMLLRHAASWRPGPASMCAPVRTTVPARGRRRNRQHGAVHAALDPPPGGCSDRLDVPRQAPGVGATVARWRSPRPEFDPELRAGLAVVGGMFPPTITDDLISFMRTSYASPPIDDELAARGIRRRDVTVPGHGGDPVDGLGPHPARSARPVPGRASSTPTPAG